MRDAKLLRECLAVQHPKAEDEWLMPDLGASGEPPQLFGNGYGVKLSAKMADAVPEATQLVGPQ